MGDFIARTQFLRFGLVGVLNTGIHLLVVATVLALTALHQMGANLLGYLAASTFSYVANTLWSFRATHHWGRYARFQGVSLAGLALSGLLGYLGDALGWHYAFTVLLIALLMPVLSFTLHRAYTYAQPSDGAALLARFPKTRPPLPDDYRRIYEREYLANRTEGSAANRLARRLESWMHRRVAATAPEGAHRILELGAGSLNHLPWEKPQDCYDVVEPFTALLDAGDGRARVRRHYPQLADVPEDARYDRIISVAVLEHLTHLPHELALAARLLAPGGVFCAGIPSEGGLLWRLAWTLGTGPAFRRRTGLDYAVLMRHEHVNTAREIEACVRRQFRQVRVRRFPLPLRTLSLYTVITARDSVTGPAP